MASANQICSGAGQGSQATDGAALTSTRLRRLRWPAALLWEALLYEGEGALT